jgi:hypothetical protein
MILRADSSSWLSWLPYISLSLLLLAMVFDLASAVDVVLLFGFTLLRNLKSAFRILQSYNLQPFIRSAKSLVIVSAITYFARWLRKWPGTKINTTDDGPKPLLFPSRTTHTRLFPKTHSFLYSYLLAGIPVGWKGSVGGMLSADQVANDAKSGFQDGSSSSSWYTVDAGDYLDRGHHHLGLDGKLRKYIQSQVCFYNFSLGSEVDAL